MTVKQTKGFYQDMEGKETFKLKEQEAQKKKEESIVMEIGGEQKEVKKIFLNKNKDLEDRGGLAAIYNKANDFLIEHSGIKIKEMATTYRLLAVMLNAGIPLIKSLKTMAVQSEKNPKLMRVLYGMAKSVEGGKSLSKSMLDYPEVFSEAQVGAVSAGEASGQLNKTMLDLASELEKSASIAGKVKGAMIYPAVIMLLLVGVVTVMMTMVIPQMKNLFEQSGNELPYVTQLLIEISNFTVEYWYIVLGVALVIVGSIYAASKTRTGKYYLDYLMLSIPIFGDLIRKSVLARFAASFGNLLGSGVPLVRALEIVAASSGNEVYRKRFLLTAEDVKAGIPIAENMSDSKLFPVMLVNMIEVGEQTAQLETVTKKISGFYNEEVDNTVQALTKIMEPLIIVVVGVTVGGLVAAIMLPIIQLTDITGGI